MIELMRSDSLSTNAITTLRLTFTITVFSVSDGANAMARLTRWTVKTIPFPKRKQVGANRLTERSRRSTIKAGNPRRNMA